MENQLLNNLLANLIGIGKQFFPRQDMTQSAEGQNLFFDILSQKMSGMADPAAGGIPLDCVLAAETGTEGQGALPKPVGEGVDTKEMAMIMSSLVSMLEMPVVQDNLAKDIDLPEITQFLKGIIEALSDGDEVRLTVAPTNLEKSSDSGTEGAKDVVSHNDRPHPFMGSLALILVALDRMAGASSQAEAVPAANAGGPAAVQTDEPRKAEVPRAVIPDVAFKNLQEGPEDAEKPPVIVDIVKPPARDVLSQARVVKDIKVEAGAPEAAENITVSPAPAPVKTTDPDLQLVRTNAPEKDGGEPEKLVIRVHETEETELRRDTSDGRENERDMAVHSEPFRHGDHKVLSETKGVVKNDFSAMMVDKIEKLTEHFAGKGMNVDMQVRLKIGDNETVLIAMRDEGSKVVVDVRATNENTVNLLQSQKDDLARSLEAKNIQTTIHVNIDQDPQGRREQNQRRGNEEHDAEGQQDFGDFFEALA